MKNIERIHPFLQIILLQNTVACTARILNQFCPPNSRDDLCLLIILFKKRWLTLAAVPEVLAGHVGRPGEKSVSSATVHRGLGLLWWIDVRNFSSKIRHQTEASNISEQQHF